MDVYAQTDCPDILSFAQSRLVFQPSGIVNSVGVFSIGGVAELNVLITVDGAGQVVEVLPCQ